MKLTQREKRIAVALGVIVALLLGYQVVWSPYQDALDKVTHDTKLASQQKEDDATLLARQRRMKPVWTDIQNNGLTVGHSNAEALINRSVLDWSKAANVHITEAQLERSNDADPFEIVTFSVSGTGSTPAIKQLLNSIETASIPVRVTDITIKPRGKEGTDDLQIHMTVSTLCLKAEAPAAKAS